MLLGRRHRAPPRRTAAAAAAAAASPSVTSNARRRRGCVVASAAARAAARQGGLADGGVSWDSDEVGSQLRDALAIPEAEYAALLEQLGGDVTLDDRDVAEALDVLLALSSRERVRRLVVCHPELLIMGFELPGWMDFFMSYGIKRGDFFKLLSTNTALFTRSSLYNAGLVIMFLTQLGLTQRDLASSIIPRCAVLLGLDPDRQLRPVVGFLQEQLRVAPQHQQAQLIARCPSLLAMSVERQLAPRFEFLHGLGLSRDDAARIASTVPSLLLSDPEPQVVPKLQFLARECELGHDAALRVASACPSVFMLSSSNLGSKWRFLHVEMGCGPAELAAYPQVLSASLLNEIGPRFVFARKLGLLHRFEQYGLHKQYGLCEQYGQYERVRWDEPNSADMSAGNKHDTGGGATGAAAEAPLASLDLAKLLGSPIPEFVGMLEADEDSFAAERFHWQVTEGRRWSGMVTVFARDDNPTLKTGSW